MVFNLPGLNKVSNLVRVCPNYKQGITRLQQVRVNSQTKGLERGWKRGARLERDAKKPLTRACEIPFKLRYHADFEKKSQLFCSCKSATRAFLGVLVSRPSPQTTKYDFTIFSPKHSLRASPPIWASEASLARTRERVMQNRVRVSNLKLIPKCWSSTPLPAPRPFGTDWQLTNGLNFN